ncbi:MAG: transcription elongation factor GreB [Bdellovibrionota bacterium]
MSKAFVNEDAAPDEDLLGEEQSDSDESGSIPKGSKNYITAKGLERLKSELHELLTVERPKLVETVAWAASNGDRSENADYIYGKRRLREIDKRVRFLNKRLDAAEVVDPSMQKGKKVLFGATVTVVGENADEKTYRIVGIDETDAKAGKVSWISPIGQALLQANEGDTVTLKTPRGDEELEICRVEYVAID